MDKLLTFQQYLATQSSQIPVFNFVLNLLIAAFLSFLLSRIYVAFGTSLSNRKAFSSTFVLITTTTMLIISIVKSSLALSLGLVGALSIVRFRAAIKEPEELAYLFIAISIGLGLGADQAVITVIGFILIVGAIWIKHIKKEKYQGENLHLVISSNDPNRTRLENIIEILKRRCTQVNLRRIDESDDLIEMAFLVGFDNFEELNRCKEELKKVGKARVTFLDNKGIYE